MLMKGLLMLVFIMNVLILEQYPHLNRLNPGEDQPQRYLRGELCQPGGEARGGGGGAH